MAEMHADDCEDLLQALSSSGFPFQTAVASVARAVGRYEVQEELAWRHCDGSAGFLDIVASADSVRVMIECKKTVSEKFVFLLPTDVSVDVETDRIWGLQLHQIQDSTRRGSVRFGLSSARPVSRESIYCVAKSANSTRLIETYVQPLVAATEAYALERYRDFKPASEKSITVPCIPVLATNAPLFVFAYNPSAVSLESGKLHVRREDLIPVPFVRLTKEFTTSCRPTVRRRTVIVCTATALSDLLVQLAEATVLRPDDAITLAS